jgi:hypothetical protein
MSLAVVEDPCIRHVLPGRVRVYVPGWKGKGKRTIETDLRHISGNAVPYLPRLPAR